jgi:predicted transcriptional regulator
LQSAAKVDSWPMKVYNKGSHPTYIEEEVLHMRTEQQIKRKYNELTMQKQSLTAHIKQATEDQQQSVESIQILLAQAERLEESIQLLEWVLDQPTGSYHV